MKKFLSLLLALSMLIPTLSVYADAVEEFDYIEDEVIWSCDFESFEVGEHPAGMGNTNAVTPSEWITVPSNTGGGIVEDEITGNKYYRFYNNTDANVTATFMQTFNMSTQNLSCFKIEFDIRTEGVAFNSRWKNSSVTTYFVNLARNSGKLHTKTFMPTQWNHIEIIVDDNKNMMKVLVNGLLATEQTFQNPYQANKGFCYYYTTATLYPEDEAFFDNWKLTRLIPKYDTGKIEKPETVEEVDYTPSTNGIPEIKDEGVVIGEAAWNQASTRTQGGMTKFGHRTYVSMNGKPSYINEFDTLTGKYIASFNCERDTAFYYSFQPASDGKIHHTNGYDWFVYDPATKKSEVYKNIYDVRCDAWGMNPGANDDRTTLYTAHSSGTDAIEYNIETGKYRIYENVTDGMKYMHAATGTDKYLLTSAGDDAGTERIIRVDKETGEKKIWYNKDPDVTAGNCPHCIAVGDYVFAAIRQWVICIDIETMTEVARFATGARGGRQRISYPMPGGDPDIIYYLSENQVGLNTFNLKTYETKVNIEKFDEVKTDLGKVEFGEWVQKKDGTWAIYACVSDTHVALITPGDPHIEYIELQTPNKGLGSVVQANYYYISRDDILYTGGYRAGVNAVDLKTNTPVFSVKQNSQHGITAANGMVFCGTYSGGQFYMIDPEKPVVAKTDNPKYYFGAKYGCRHYNVSETNAGFCMHNSIADYGQDAGSVVVSTYANGKAMGKEIGKVIVGENTTGQCYKDGYIYASTSVVVNLHDPHYEAHIAKIDAKTNEVVKVMAYEIPDVGPLKVISEPVIAPNGKLYAVANQGVTLLEVDPETMELTRYKSYYKQRVVTDTYIGDLLIMGADGVLYTSMGDQLHAVNLETFEAKLLWNNIDRFILDNDGNIIKRKGGNSSGTDLVSLSVNPRQRLAIMIENAKKYYKEEDFSKTSWKIYMNALSDAEKIDLYKDSTEAVKTAARKLTFAIKDLQTKFDEEAGFAYIFGDNMAAFADMTGYSDLEALKAVNTLKHSKIISGIDNKTFAPDNSITRAEFVKLLSVIEGCDDETVETPYEFSDVKKDNWYYNYVNIAYEKGWIKGVSETEFAPEEIITDEQMKLILNRIKENSFESGKNEATTRAEAAKLLYAYINK